MRYINHVVRVRTKAQEKVRVDNWIRVLVKAQVRAHTGVTIWDHLIIRVRTQVRDQLQEDKS